MHSEAPQAILNTMNTLKRSPRCTCAGGRLGSALARVSGQVWCLCSPGRGPPNILRDGTIHSSADSMAKEGKTDPLCGWCMQTVTDLEDRVVSHCSLEGECTGGPTGVVCHYECAHPTASPLPNQRLATVNGS